MSGRLPPPGTQLPNARTLAGSGPLAGGTDSYLVGSKKRRLDPVVLAVLPGSETGMTNPATSFTLKLKGLSDDLSILIAAGVSGGDSVSPILPSVYPTTPGTLQVIPKTNHQSWPLFLREVFQDPTATDNHDHALAQDMPYGWSFSPGGVDEALIVVSLPLNSWHSVSVVGQLVVEVTVEYIGSALNVSNADNRRLIEWILGQVQITGGPQPPLQFGG